MCLKSSLWLQLSAIKSIISDALANFSLWIPRTHPGIILHSLAVMCCFIGSLPLEIEALNLLRLWCYPSWCPISCSSVISNTLYYKSMITLRERVSYHLTALINCRWFRLKSSSFSIAWGWNLADANAVRSQFLKISSSININGPLFSSELVDPPSSDSGLLCEFALCSFLP